MQKTFQPVLVPRWHTEPRSAGDTWLDPRRRRTRLRLSHAYGAAFDNPSLIVAAVVGDGEAETGPLATGWHGNKFSTPPAMAPFCPSCTLMAIRSRTLFLARIPHDELQKLFEGYGYKPYFVEGHEPEKMHQLMASALDAVTAKFSESGRRLEHTVSRPARMADDHPPSPKGWDMPGGDRREEVRGILARAPGADERHGQTKPRGKFSRAG